MSAISIAVVGKNDEPLYMREFSETSEDIREERLFGLPMTDRQDVGLGGFDCSLRQQFILHSALGRIKQLAGPPPGLAWRKPGTPSGRDSMFAGFLCPVEEMRVYGYVTTTKIKFILVVEDEAAPDLQKNVDEEIKSLLIKVHQTYIENILNPFVDTDGPITSKRFDGAIQQHIANFNQTEGML